MKLSIITINFNNPKGLENTIRSVITQSMSPYEYIVIDGASTKGDVDIIQKYDKYLTRWVSEPDSGIYSAINKGANLSSGDYCLFLNSGDTLYDNHVIEKISILNLNEDFIEGRVLTDGRFSKINEKYTLATFLWKRNPYHQGSLIKRDLIMEYPYNETYRIAGDLDFNIHHLIIKGCSYRAINLVISNYEGGGISEMVKHQDEINRCYSCFPNAVLQDYQNLEWINHFPANVLLKYIHKLTSSPTVFRVKLFCKRLMGKKIDKNDKYEFQLRINSKL